MSRPTGFYRTYDVAAGDLVKVGCLALLQSGVLVDADATSVTNMGTPVMVDSGEHTIPDDGETALDNRNGATAGPREGAPSGVRARVVNGEAFLLNTKEAVTTADEGKDVYAIDNDTVSLADDDVGDGTGNAIPRVGHIARVEGSNSAFVIVDGVA